MASKKEQQPLTPRDLDKDRWIKTPVVYAQQVATLNRMQQNVMFLVSKKMQKYIEGFFDEGRNKLNIDPNPAIPEEVIKSGMPMVRLMMSDIADKYHYGRLMEALRDIMDLSIKSSSIEQLTDKNGNPAFDKNGKPVMRKVYKLTPIFSQISVPELDKNFQYKDRVSGSLLESANFKAGYIDFRINPYVAGVIFDMNHGFVEHLARIAKYSKTDAAPKIYIFIKTKMFVYHSAKFRVSVQELKQATGHYRVDRNVDGVDVVDEKYPRWNDYKNYVLEPAKKDLERLALINDTEFTFRYLPVYKGLKKRGTPDEIELLVYPTQLGKERKKSKGKAPQVVERDLFASNPASRQEMGRQDWNGLVAAYNGSLKEVFTKATFLKVVPDEGGLSFSVLFASEDDYNKAKTEQKEINAFLDLCRKKFGITYRNIIGGYRKV